MFSIKNNIIYFIVFNTLIQIQGLVEVPAVEDNEIASTEEVLRTTTNRIFSLFHLKRVKHKARIKQFAAIHNFFVTITLQDHDNLKHIAQLAKVNKIDNTTQLFITQLNEVLNEDIKSNEATDEDVTKIIETFVKKLENLKQVYRFKTKYVEINKEVLKFLNRDGDFLGNLTKQLEKTNHTDENGTVTYDSEGEEAYWRPSGRRVYQAQKVRIKRFPFMASVQFFKKFQCGGSIIKSDLVITAASCLQLAWNNRFFRENPSFLSVQVGSEFYEKGEENIPILEVYFHPEYNPKNLANNLAVMRLTRIINFQRKGTKVKKIDFDRNPWPLPQNIGAITIVGWGAQTSSNTLSQPWNNRLGYAHLDFYALDLCREVYTKEYVTNKNFCAGFLSTGGGACNRDVGGPGIANGILVGVVSFGSPNCGAVDAPTVFTKLGYYAEWIDDILDMKVPTRAAKTTPKPHKIEYYIDEKYITTTESLLKPIRMGDEAPFESIKEADQDLLRTVTEDQLFKEFIATMFGSPEVKENLGQSDDASDDNVTISEKILNELIENTTVLSDVEDPEAGYEEAMAPGVIVGAEPDSDRHAEHDSKPDSDRDAEAEVEPDAESDVEPYAEPDAEPEAEPVLARIKPKRSKHHKVKVKMVTTMEDFTILPSKGAASTPSHNMKSHTTLNDKEHDRKVEQKIAQLIENIDIKDLLESDSNETKLMEVAEKLEEETLLELNVSEYTDSSDYDFVPGLNGSRKVQEEGLSIPVMPVKPAKDLTFFQNHTEYTTSVRPIIKQVYPIPVRTQKLKTIFLHHKNHKNANKQHTS